MRLMEGTGVDELVLEGVRCATLSELLRQIHPIRHWAVADLSLGAWRGHQAARDIAAQLGAPPPDSPTSSGISGDSISALSYADVVGQWIDQESRGDRAVLESLEWIRRIHAAAAAGPVRNLLVLAPHGDEPWQRENVLFISLLARAVRHIGGRILLANRGGADPDLPAGWRVHWHGTHEPQDSGARRSLLALVPGVLERTLLQDLSLPGDDAEPVLQPLGGGCQLVAPECRPVSTSRLDFDRLALAAAAIAWLRAYAEFRGNHLFVDPYRLCKEAWKRQDEAGSGIAQRLLARAMDCAPSVELRALFQAQLQGLRIGTRDYETAGAIEDPPPVVPTELRGFLMQTKGWGLAMGRQARGAAAGLDRIA